MTRPSADTSADAQMTDEPDRPQVWTAWLDYSATGEGRTLVAFMACATSRVEFEQQLTLKLGEWLQKACWIRPGVVRNDVTRYLWSEEALRLFEESGRRPGQLVAHAVVNLNVG